ncbi:hypothetical protein [Salsuginibacillus kocurii]|uniref:hypothetical protein n=1 Tax=Salsuginibacillus kocurii TaxID=427078 RepID=UPI00037FF415|nr:hypothetical protein [Salsuginibacillus kocurii]
MDSDAKKGMIQLVEYDEQLADKLIDFHLTDEQLQFTSHPWEHIQASPMLATNHILIVSGELPVGYFALQAGDKLGEYSKNRNARLLSAFSIDSRYVGQVFAKKGLELLAPFIHTTLPQINEVVLGVNKRNQAAIQLNQFHNDVLRAIKRILSIYLLFTIRHFKSD